MCITYIIKISLFYLFFPYLSFQTRPLSICFICASLFLIYYIKKMILIRFSTCSMRDPFSVIYIFDFCAVFQFIGSTCYSLTMVSQWVLFIRLHLSTGWTRMAAWTSVTMSGGTTSCWRRRRTFMRSYTFGGTPLWVTFSLLFSPTRVKLKPNIGNAMVYASAFFFGIRGRTTMQQ